MNLKSVNVEVTTACNAKCPLCIRHRDFHTLKPKDFIIPKLYLDIDKFEALDWNNTNFDIILLCGSFGDPILHPNLFHLIDVIHNIGKKIILSTNGELHNTSWWIKLAKHCNDNDKIIFGIDGLNEETHIKYRGTSLTNVMQNIKAFTGAGGHASMQFIIFEHNEHQISEIKSFKRRLGLQEVEIKNSRIYTDVLKKYKGQYKIKSEKHCFAEMGKVAMDIDAKLYICCILYIMHFFDNTKIITYNTFERLQKSVYFEVIKKMDLCKSCREFL